MDLAIAAALAFFIGSLPFGYWIGLAKGVDVRKIGSGNVGATNVSRALGPRLGLVAFVLDVVKGALPAALALNYFGRQDIAFYIGLVAVAGHCLSPFLGFKGGKGVATGLGMMAGSSPVIAAIVFGTFLIFFFFTRYVSLSSLIATSLLVPVGFLLNYPAPVLIGFALLTVFIFYRHRSNIGRLRDGVEPKFTFKKGNGAPPDQKGQDEPAESDE